MRLVFAGTPPFSVAALEALDAAGHQVAAVYTQPDRPAGRGRKLQASAVAQRAAQLRLPVRKPERFTDEAIAGLRALKPDAMVVVAYGLILPPAVLEVPERGCFNIHASLLPRWRGAAPIQRAILAGDRETGVTIMRMDAGLDTGPMLLREALDIGETETAGELQERLSELGARLMVEVLHRLDELKETEQPPGATYAKKLSKDEARLDWTRPARELDRAVRAFNPAPVAWTELGEERIRIHRARPAPGASAAAPGTVVECAGGMGVATGEGVLEVLELQRPGGTAVPAAQALRPRLGRRFS